MDFWPGRRRRDDCELRGIYHAGTASAAAAVCRREGKHARRAEPVRGGEHVRDKRLCPPLYYPISRGRGYGDGFERVAGKIYDRFP